MTTPTTIPIEKIVKGHNPRTHIDPVQLEELAQSIKERDLIQPITVEKYRRGYFLLVAGERRLEAHKLLHRKTIKAIVRERTNHNGRERLLDAVIENDQRADVDPIDRANAYLVLRNQYKLTTRQISQYVGRPSHVIENSLLLTQLDPPIQELMRKGFWTDSRLVRGLMQIPDPEIRIALAGKLFQERVNLKGCLVAVEGTIASLHAPKLERRGRPPKNGLEAKLTRKTAIRADQVPAMEVAEVTEKPMRWDALRQLGRVPEWILVVQAAQSTCQVCPLRDRASAFNCGGCPAVTILQQMAKVTK